MLSWCSATVAMFLSLSLLSEMAMLIRCWAVTKGGCWLLESNGKESYSKTTLKVLLRCLTNANILTSRKKSVHHVHSHSSMISTVRKPGNWLKFGRKSRKDFLTNKTTKVFTFSSYKLSKIFITKNITRIDTFFAKFKCFLHQ